LRRPYPCAPAKAIRRRMRIVRAGDSAKYR
jgi:hypothetical protein